MKKCKICHVEAELVDGRCQSCRRAKEATDRGMSYGQLVAEIDPPKVREVRDRTATCEWCGAIFLRTKRRTKYCSTECENKAITNPTLWGKIRSLPAEDFVEYLYLIVASMFEQNGIDFEITEENKAATLAQLTQPHVGYKHG